MSVSRGILLQKSFWGDKRNFLESLMRFTSGDVRGPYSFIQNRPGTSIVALKSDTAAEESKDQLSRDYLDCSIFDFCDKQKSSCFRIVVKTKRAAASFPWVAFESIK